MFAIKILLPCNVGSVNLVFSCVPFIPQALSVLKPFPNGVQEVQDPSRKQEREEYETGDEQKNNRHMGPLYTA